MKRIILITILIVGLTAVFSFAQMHEGMMGSQSRQQTGGTTYNSGNYPCKQMMGPGMMGYGEYGMMRPEMRMGSGMMGQGMMGHGMGSGMREHNSEAYQKFLNETADLRKELHNRKFEYFEALRNPDTKREAILKIEKGIWDLKWKIYEKSPR